MPPIRFVEFFAFFAYSFSFFQKIHSKFKSCCHFLFRKKEKKKKTTTAQFKSLTFRITVKTAIFYEFWGYVVLQKIAYNRYRSPDSFQFIKIDQSKHYVIVFMSAGDDFEKEQCKRSKWTVSKMFTGAQVIWQWRTSARVMTYMYIKLCMISLFFVHHLSLFFPIVLSLHRIYHC